MPENKEIDIKKCKMACDLVLASMSHGHDVKTKLDYYHELVRVVDDYERVKNENEKLRRENFGLHQTVDNLRRREQKVYDDLSWKKEFKTKSI